MSTPPLLLADQVQRIEAGHATSTDVLRLSSICADLFDLAERTWDSGKSGSASLWEVASTLAQLIDHHPERGRDILEVLASAFDVARGHHLTPA